MSNFPDPQKIVLLLAGLLEDPPEYPLPTLVPIERVHYLVEIDTYHHPDRELDARWVRARDKVLSAIYGDPDLPASCHIHGLAAGRADAWEHPNLPLLCLEHPLLEKYLLDQPSRRWHSVLTGLYTYVKLTVPTPAFHNPDISKHPRAAELLLIQEGLCTWWENQDPDDPYLDHPKGNP